MQPIKQFIVTVTIQTLYNTRWLDRKCWDANNTNKSYKLNQNYGKTI